MRQWPHKQKAVNKQISQQIKWTVSWWLFTPEISTVKMKSPEGENVCNFPTETNQNKCKFPLEGLELGAVKHPPTAPHSSCTNQDISICLPLLISPSMHLWGACRCESACLLWFGRCPPECTWGSALTWCGPKQQNDFTGGCLFPFLMVKYWCWALSVEELRIFSRLLDDFNLC